MKDPYFVFIYFYYNNPSQIKINTVNAYSFLLLGSAYCVILTALASSFRFTYSYTECLPCICSKASLLDECVPSSRPTSRNPRLFSHEEPRATFNARLIHAYMHGFGFGSSGLFIYIHKVAYNNGDFPVI